MPFYLRAINKNRWYRSAVPSWLPENDIPAQPLADLIPRPEENLSLWYIDDDRLNLKRVAAAIVSGRERIDKFDYALFTQEAIEVAGLSVVQSVGKTPDEQANIDWHWEVPELTADRVVRFAKAIYSRVETKRITPIVMRGLIVEALAAGQLETKKISRRLLDDLQAGSVSSESV